MGVGEWQARKEGRRKSDGWVVGRQRSSERVAEKEREWGGGGGGGGREGAREKAERVPAQRR